jgi:hypothetical protein
MNRFALGETVTELIIDAGGGGGDTELPPPQLERAMVLSTARPTDRTGARKKEHTQIFVTVVPLLNDPAC